MFDEHHQIRTCFFEALCTITEVCCNGLTTTDTIHGLTKNTTYYMSIFYFGTTDRGTFDFCIYENNTTGIREFDAQSDISLYPNPAKNEVSVHVNSDSRERSTIQLVDLSGRIIYQANNLNLAENMMHQIDISNFGKGIYLVEVISTEGKAVKK